MTPTEFIRPRCKDHSIINMFQFQCLIIICICAYLQIRISVYRLEHTSGGAMEDNSFTFCSLGIKWIALKSLGSLYLYKMFCSVLFWLFIYLILVNGYLISNFMINVNLKKLQPKLIALEIKHCKDISMLWIIYTAIK